MDEATIRVDVIGAVEQAVQVLRAGGTVVLPTDTVYGLAALPTVSGATDALVDLKGRSSEQPFAVLVASAGQAGDLGELSSREARDWMDEFWPGPLTLVVRRRATAAPLALGGSPETIGLRCPDHAFVRAVAATAGPIATTSANRHGELSPTTADAAAEALLGPVDLVVDGGPAGALGSTVIDLTDASPRVLRRGTLDPARLGL